MIDPFQTKGENKGENMKKSDLLKMIDQDLLDKLFGFCYHRTANSHEAEALCSDILFALIKAANTEGDLESPHAFIWRVARNVYADHAAQRKRESERHSPSDPEELFRNLPDTEDGENREDDEAQLRRIYRQISYLTRAYREVMIAYYLNGKSVREIAKAQNATETAIRQRLFSARESVKKGVTNMENQKPLALETLDYTIWGTGSPGWGDPREICQRQFSKHIVWLCRNKEMSATEIANRLNTPTVYVEEELEIQAHGVNGKYGMLKKTASGKYTTNFVLLDCQEIQKAESVYIDRIPMICNAVTAYIEQHKDDYLSFPYLNKSVDLNLILWQQIFDISNILQQLVQELLKENHFADIEPVKRPFSIFGYRDFDGKTDWGGGWDGIRGSNICGYSDIHLDNIYITRIKKHFGCGHNISLDPKIQFAIRAIDGLRIDTLTESEKEEVAKAIQCGYLYREDSTVYTKILTLKKEDQSRLFSLNCGLRNAFRTEAETVAKEIADFIRQALPSHLYHEYKYVNMLAGAPVLDTLVEHLIDSGILTPPENGIGAEGCWMTLEK